MSGEPHPLTRIHSILQHQVVVRDADIELIVNQTEALLSDETFAINPMLRNCIGPDGWLPIASLLNYSPLGQTVWSFGGVGVVADCLTTRGSHLIELSGDASCVRKLPLRVQIRQAIEYIFSDANFHKDVHLQLLQDKPEGFVSVSKLVSSYPNVGQLVQRLNSHGSLGSKDPQRTLVEALSSSAEVVVKNASLAGGAGGSAPPSLAVRRKTLAERICSQVEYYLECDRMSSDRFLYETSCDHDGWIPIPTLLSFPRMRKLCHPQALAVAHVLSASAHLEISPDQTYVRPSRTPPASPARASHKLAKAFAPVSRRMEPEAPPAGTCVDFSLMTYNVLADMLCTTEQV